MENTDRNLLEKHLLTRKLVDPAALTKLIIDGGELKVGGEVLDNSETLERVAGMYETNRAALEAVVAARLMPIIVQLIFKCDPVEVTVLRQSMLELTGLLTDFDKYHKEKMRRGKSKEDAAEAVIEEKAGKKDASSMG